MEPSLEFILLHYLLALSWFTKSQSTVETVDDVTSAQQFSTADEVTSAHQFTTADDVTLTTQQFSTADDITTTQHFTTVTEDDITTTQNFATVHDTTTTQHVATVADSATTQPFATVNDITSTQPLFTTTPEHSTTTNRPENSWLRTIQSSTAHSRSGPLTMTSALGVMHFYFYFGNATNSGDTGQTWSEAVETCQAMGSYPDSCYLFYPDERVETLRFLALKDSDHYSSDLWVNYYNIGNDIYSGRTEQPVSYPSIRDVYIPWLWLGPNGTLYLGSAMFTHFKSEPSTSKRKDFFCECEDVCAPVVQACRTHCCEQGRVQCTVVNGSTASCSCPTGS